MQGHRAQSVTLWVVHSELQRKGHRSQSTFCDCIVAAPFYAFLSTVLRNTAS